MPIASPLAVRTLAEIRLRIMTFFCFQMKSPMPVISLCACQLMRDRMKTGVCLLAPGRPIMLLLEPMRILVEPVMEPLTTTTPAAVPSATAAVNWARVETVVVVPPVPPVVPPF